MRRANPEIWVMVLTIIGLIVGPFLVGLAIFKVINLIRDSRKKPPIAEPFFGMLAVGWMVSASTLYLVHLSGMFDD